MKFALVTAAALSLGALTACAEYYGPGHHPSASPHGAVAMGPPGAMPAGMCFRSSDIRNHSVGDERTMYLDVSGRGVYRVDMSAACLAGASSSDPIVMRQPPGSNIICRPMDLDITVSRGSFESRCIVVGVSPMTPEQVAALPPRARP